MRGPDSARRSEGEEQTAIRQGGLLGKGFPSNRQPDSLLGVKSCLGLVDNVELLAVSHHVLLMMCHVWHVVHEADCPGDQSELLASFWKCSVQMTS